MRREISLGIFGYQVPFLLTSAHSQGGRAVQCTAIGVSESSDVGLGDSKHDIHRSLSLVQKKNLSKFLSNSRQLYFKPNINFVTVGYNLTKLYVVKSTSFIWAAICISTKARKLHLHCSDCCSSEYFHMGMPWLAISIGIGHSSID